MKNKQGYIFCRALPYNPPIFTCLKIGFNDPTHSPWRLKSTGFPQKIYPIFWEQSIPQSLFISGKGRGSGRLEKLWVTISQNPTALRAATASEWKHFVQYFLLRKNTGGW